MYYTFDIGFNAAFPKALVNTLVRKAYEVIEHLRADRDLKLIDVYHEYVFRPEDHLLVLGSDTDLNKFLKKL